MTEKNDFKLDVVSIRLVKEAPIYSEQSFNKPEEVAAVMGDCMCQFDREVVCVVNLSSDLKPKSNEKARENAEQNHGNPDREKKDTPFR